MNKHVALNVTLLIYRSGISLMMMTHGFSKLTRLLEGQVSFADPLGFGQTATLLLAILAEFIALMLIILGWKTRYAAIPVVGVMSVAAFMVHAADPFAQKELALLYLLAFLMVVFVGPGKYSLDKK